MIRLRHQALAAGYAVALVVVLLCLVVAFGHVGAREGAVAAVLAVPLTVLGARMIGAGLAAGPDPGEQAESRPSPAG